MQMRRGATTGVVMVMGAVMSGATATVGQAGQMSAGNPFAAESTLPFQAPPWDRITDADFEPALEAGIAAHEREIERIANDPAKPDFGNTYEAMERSGALLNRAMRALAR